MQTTPGHVEALRFYDTLDTMADTRGMGKGQDGLSDTAGDRDTRLSDTILGSKG